MGNGQEVQNYKGSGGRGCEGIKRDAAAGTEEAERRRQERKVLGKDQERHTCHREEACGLGPGCPLGRRGCCEGHDVSPPSPSVP